MKKKFRREYLRAPLKANVLYIDDDYVLKARTENISEGGILLENIPKIPVVPAIPLMMSIPHFPLLNRMTEERIMSFGPNSFDSDIIRVKARVVRSFEGKSEVEAVFMTHIGCEFVVMDEQTRSIIGQYVENFARNVVYLLGLFERHANPELIRHVAELLGYPIYQKINLLRMKVLHDYQSLESL